MTFFKFHVPTNEISDCAVQSRIQSMLTATHAACAICVDLNSTIPWLLVAVTYFAVLHSKNKRWLEEMSNLQESWNEIWDLRRIVLREIVLCAFLPTTPSLSCGHLYCARCITEELQTVPTVPIVTGGSIRKIQQRSYLELCTNLFKPFFLNINSLKKTAFFIL
jgi:hypothetical protein